MLLSDEFVTRTRGALKAKLSDAEFGVGSAETQAADIAAAQADLQAFDAVVAESKKSHRFTSPEQPYNRPRREDEFSRVTSADPKSYRAIHGLPERLSNGGFQSAGEFLQLVASGRHDERLMQCASGAQIALGTSGGWMVPEAFAADNLHPPTEGEIVLPRATVYSIPGDSLRIAGVDASTNSGGAINGMTAQWVPEHGEITLQDVPTVQIKLELRKLAILHKSSNELLSATDWERHAVPAFQSAISDFRDNAYLNGDGSGKPLGALNAASTISVAKETAQAAATIVYENLSGMYSRMHPACVGSAVWVCNPSCIPQLLRLTIAGGTSAMPVSVLNEANGSFSLFGRPLLLSSKLPVLGTVGDILFADFSQYAVGVARGIVIDRSEHYGFNKDATYWRVVYRTDGQPKWSTAFTPRNGSTLSWCVKLATRA